MKKNIFIFVFLLVQWGSLVDALADILVERKNINEVTLLKAPSFLNENGGISDAWGGVQHAGEISFHIEVNDGVLSIVKTGSQPWYSFVQKVDARPLIGKYLEYSAEIMLELNVENVYHAFERGGGLYLLVYGEIDPLVGEVILYNGILKHKPKLGNVEWRRVSERFVVPKHATKIVVGFVHQANGALFAKNPSLRVSKKSIVDN